MEPAKRTLITVLNEMNAARDLSNKDPERGHSEADRLLVELVRMLSVKATYKDSETVEQILSTYDDVEKYNV